MSDIKTDHIPGGPISRRGLFRLVGGTAIGAAAFTGIQMLQLADATPGDFKEQLGMNLSFDRLEQPNSNFNEHVTHIGQLLKALNWKQLKPGFSVDIDVIGNNQGQKSTFKAQIGEKIRQDLLKLPQNNSAQPITQENVEKVSREIIGQKTVEGLPIDEASAAYQSPEFTVSSKDLQLPDDIKKLLPQTFNCFRIRGVGFNPDVSQKGVEKRILDMYYVFTRDEKGEAQDLMLPQKTTDMESHWDNAKFKYDEKYNFTSQSDVDKQMTPEKTKALHTALTVQFNKQAK